MQKLKIDNGSVKITGNEMSLIMTKAEKASDNGEDSVKLWIHRKI